MEQRSLFQKPIAPKDKIVNVASIPQRSPFRYPGGKTWFVPRLRKWLNSQKKMPRSARRTVCWRRNYLSDCGL